MNRFPIRIVGGGMTGLTLALRLARRGVPIVVYERDPYLGGLASEATLAGVPIERFYHCVLPTDEALLSLFDNLGLGADVGWTRTRTGFFTDGRLLEMTTTLDFLRFPAITISDRLRLGWTIAFCGLNRSWTRLDEEPIGPFLRRHGGDRLFDRIWEPLLLSKLGPEYNRFAASFIWATVYRMFSARKAKGRAEKLGFVAGRYGKVFAALRRAIEEAGGEVRVGSSVAGLVKLESQSGPRWAVIVDGKQESADGVVLCVPAPVAAGWLKELSLPAANQLEQVEYLGVICDVLLLKRSLTPYYVLNLTDRSLPFTGVIEMSNLTGLDEYKGNAVVYLPRYRGQTSSDWSRDDDDLHRENLQALRRIVPDFKDSDAVAWQINRARFVQPVHAVGRGRQLPPVSLAAGLAYLSTAHIHPWPVFNNEVVRLVDRRLEEILLAVGSRTNP